MFEKRLWSRHLIIAFPSIFLLAWFWFSRLDWDPEMRLWRAVGDVSWVLLSLSLMIGPAVRLWQPTARLLTWRREVGIWFGVLALAHALLVLNGWVRWDVMRFFGYEFVNQLGRQARVEPGFGLSNVLGLIALIWALILTATSSNWAINRLGGSAWKWLHSGAYVVFYLVTAHIFYFLFIHYTVSFHRVPPTNPNWLNWPFLIVTVSVPLLQALAFAKTVSRRKNAARVSNS